MGQPAGVAHGAAKLQGTPVIQFGRFRTAHVHRYFAQVDDRVEFRVTIARRQADSLLAPVNDQGAVELTAPSGQIAQIVQRGRQQRRRVLPLNLP